jgi:3-oxoacyl-[acyl-carrier protein] reductase
VTVNVVVPGGPADTQQIPDGLIPDRNTLLRPDVMVPAIRWLCSDDASDVNGLRFDAVHWSDDLPVEEALAKSTEPVAWRQLEKSIVMPD